MNDPVAAKIQLADFLDRKMMVIERLARQCPTLGDLHDLVMGRYDAFGREIAALTSETPSVDRYERICHAVADALLLSVGFQDTTILFSSHLQTAFDLMCERPKTPSSGSAISTDDFLFDADEVRRVAAAAVVVYRAFAALMTEIYGESSPLELKIRDNAALAAVRALPSTERPMAVLFVRSGDRWRFSNDILMLLQPLLMRKAHVFDNWEQQGALIRKLPLKAFTARDKMRQLFDVARPALEEAARRCNAHAIDATLSLDDGSRPANENRARSLVALSSPGKEPVCGADDEQPETREVGRFTIDEYAHRVVYTDHDHPKFVRYEFYRKKTNRGTSAFEAVRQLVNDYKAGQRQTRNSAKWKGAFQDGENRGDAHRFMKEQVFRLPRWSAEKGRFIRGQFEGKWRLWTDDEMKLSEDERVRRFIDEHPQGLPRRF